MKNSENDGVRGSASIAVFCVDCDAIVSSLPGLPAKLFEPLGKRQNVKTSFAERRQLPQNSSMS
jgi:hypothetical protein